MNIGSERLTALTDGVVAVIITIMVLELKPPYRDHLASRRRMRALASATVCRSSQAGR